MTEIATRPDQVTYLDDETTLLVERIDELLLGWMTRSGAEPALPPPLVAVSDLERIDYFQNFPHQANVVSTVRTDDGPVAPDDLEGAQLNRADFVVPSAACYGMYVQYADSVLPGPALRTGRLACARAEDTYERFRRLRTYWVREYLYLGTADGAKGFVDDVVAWLRRLIEALELPATVESATDSFFDRDSSKALLEKISKAKQEIVYNEQLAVSSVNYHRNFFGESYDIRLPDGSHVHTACFGAGLERWAGMLLEHCGSARAALELLDSLESRPEW